MNDINPIYLIVALAVTQLATLARLGWAIARIKHLERVHGRS